MAAIDDMTSGMLFTADGEKQQAQEPVAQVRQRLL